MLETAEKNTSDHSRKEREACRYASSGNEHTALESTDSASNRGGRAGDGMDKLRRRLIRLVTWLYHIPSLKYWWVMAVIV